MVADLKQLQDRVEENKDEETIRRLKKERDTLGLKNSEILLELEDVRREVENLLKERRDAMTTHTKELEEERAL